VLFLIGVVNNGEDVGDIEFRVPFEAPNTLFLISENEQSMQLPLGIGDFISNFNYPDLELFETSISTSGSVIIASIDPSVFRSLELDLQISQDNNHHYSQLYAIHDGTNVTLAEFHNVDVGSGSVIFNINAIIEDSSLNFYLTVQDSGTASARVVTSIKDRVIV
jgi:hypothetical protein